MIGTNGTGTEKRMEKTQKKQYRFIGDKSFYKMVLLIAVPIMVQNGITNFVGLLDNIMIGRIGTEQMSGVAIVNQLLFVYQLCLFGAVSGAGIFTAQYYGQKNQEGIRQTVRFKLWIVSLITLITVVLFLFAKDILISRYLQGEGTIESAEATLHYGRQYLAIMLPGLLPFALMQVYSSSLRECGQTVLPMKAGIIAVFVNLLLNYILIYGKFGLPALGVQGAAAATVVSRIVEALIVLIYTHKHKSEYPFVQGLYASLKVSPNLTAKIITKGMPLLLNETLWATGMAVLAQCYSMRGLGVIAALNISNTINNVFNIVFIALGESVAIIIGQLLGAGKMEEAKDKDTKLIAFSVFSCSLVALMMLVLARFFPLLFKTDDEVRRLAAHFIMITALFMPQNAFLHASYFTLRSGGKTVITFLFDSVFIWCVSVTIAYILAHFTKLPVTAVYLFVQMGDWIKCAIGFVLVKKGIWLQNIVS